MLAAGFGNVLICHVMVRLSLRGNRRVRCLVHLEDPHSEAPQVAPSCMVKEVGVPLSCVVAR